MNDDVELGFIKEKFLRCKGKSANYARLSDIYLEARRKNKAVDQQGFIPIPATLSQTSINVRHDVWFHIAMEVAPEDVQSFALICTQTARLVNTGAFWRNMYKRYCLDTTGTKWNLKLQLEQMSKCDTKTLRSVVIKTLYQSYTPLKSRNDLGFKLDWLLNRTFVSCWQVHHHDCLWVTRYKFCHQKVYCRRQEDETQSTAPKVANDWEDLAEESVYSVSENECIQGVVFLIVLSKNFVPIPTQIAYNQQHSRYRLKATRELLSTDMRSTNLELSFAEDCSSNVSVVIKYIQLEKYMVLPWFHSEFEKFVK